MAEISRTELWIPGQGYELSQEYPVPSNEELQAHWADYLGQGNVAAAPGVFGVICMPEERPRAYASIDLCEVVRQTSMAYRSVEGIESGSIGSIHNYGDGLSICNDPVVAQVLMANGHVPPIQGVEDIASIIQDWRRAGVYVFANTSTLPGCELATIKFFGQYLPNAFDGLLLPRNYDGNLPVTKGIAARNLLQLFGEGVGSDVAAIHIDDVAHHNIGFRNALSTIGVCAMTFQPMYPSHYPADEGSVQTTTPLAAFEQADTFLTGQIH